MNDDSDYIIYKFTKFSIIYWRIKYCWNNVIFFIFNFYMLFRTMLIIIHSVSCRVLPIHIRNIWSITTINISTKTVYSKWYCLLSIHREIKHYIITIIPIQHKKWNKFMSLIKYIVVLYYEECINKNLKNTEWTVTASSIVSEKKHAMIY